MQRNRKCVSNSYVAEDSNAWSGHKRGKQWRGKSWDIMAKIGTGRVRQKVGRKVIVQFTGVSKGKRGRWLQYKGGRR